MNTGTLTFLLLFLLLFSVANESKCIKRGKVKHQTPTGWSRQYNMDVIFLTGYELNNETCTFRYHGNSVYAIIYCYKNEPTIIKLSISLLCAAEITCDYFDKILLDFEGYDQEGDRWNICIYNLCF